MGLPQKQALLIDSILRGYDIPKFYVRPASNKDFTWEVVDGERTPAINDYLDDHFVLPSESFDLPVGARFFQEEVQRTPG